MSTLYRNIAIVVLLLAPLLIATQPVHVAAQSSGSGAHCVNLPKTIAKGNSGPDVTDLQNFLMSEGVMQGSATGYFGVLTEAAVKNWQGAHGIEQLGIVGPKTRLAMACTGGTTTQTISNQCPVVPQPSICANAISVQLNGCTVGWQCSVAALPSETFNASPRTGQAPLVVKFSGVVTSADAGFCIGKFCAATLVFGDGTTGAVPLPNAQGAAISYEINHTYTTGGSFVANLYQGSAGNGAPIVGNGIAITATAPVGTPTVTGAPTISVSPNYGTAPLPTTVTVANVASSANLSVEFGDGSFSSLQQTGSVFTATHTYINGGSYTIKLRRVNNAGDTCSSDTCQVLASVSLSIAGAQVATASLVATPSSGLAPLPVTFFANGASVSYPGGVVLDFGDNTTEIVCQQGSICGQKTSTHTYATAGTYTVQLLGFGSGGTTILKTTSVNVVTPGASSLQASPNSGAVPLAVTFTGNGGNRTFPNGVIIKYGDDTSETFCSANEFCGQKTKTHTYNDGSQYSAQLVGMGDGTASTTLATALVSATGGTTKIKVTAPTGSARKGASVPLSWTVKGTKPTSGSLSFDLYSQSGTRIGTILTITNFQSGSATWKIPSSKDTGCSSTQPNGLCGVNLTPGMYKIQAYVSGVSPQPELTTDALIEIKDEEILPGNFTVSITPVSAEIGRPMSIKYKVANPPYNGAVALWLAKTNGEKVGLIASQLEADPETTTFSWTIPATMCEVGASSGGSTCPKTNIVPGDYKILGQVYSPLTKDVYSSSSGVVHVESSSSNFAIKAVGTGGACTVLSNNLSPGDTDATTGGEVSKLQQFLAEDADIYPEGTVSGFYGNATRRAVERWQTAHGIATSGSVETNGFGALGPKTRAAIAATCGTAGATLSATPRSGPAALKVTFKGKVPAVGTYTIDFGDGVGVGSYTFTNECAAASATYPNAFHICNLTFEKLEYTFANNGTYIVKMTPQGAAKPIATVTVTVGGALEEDCAAITRQLNPGDTDAAKGGDVSRLQQYLAKNPALYPEGLVTGYYGPATVAAVKRYQDANGIAQTGAVGPATLAAMKCTSTTATTAIFEATPTSGKAPLKVTFKTSIDVTGGSYRIDFGDDTSTWLTSQTAEHTYTVEGAHTAQLVKSIGNCYGLTGSALKICEIGYSTVQGQGTIIVDPTPAAAPTPTTDTTTDTTTTVTDTAVAGVDNPSGCGRLSAGAWIRRGHSVTSCNGYNRIVVSPTGALYFEDIGALGYNTPPKYDITPGSQSWNYPTAEGLYMSPGGDLVYYLTPTVPLFSTYTLGNPGAYLSMDGVGYWFIYRSNGSQAYPTAAMYQ